MDQSDELNSGEPSDANFESPEEPTDSAEEDSSWSCPLPESHDRFSEAHYFLHRMEEVYHDPQLFRFHLHAFIAALRAVHELLQKELERLGEVAWWKVRNREFKEDLVLSAFARGRNIALHQKAIFDGSRVSIGVFRGRRLKLATYSDLKSDETSQSLLERLAPLHIGFIMDEEHSALGEQIGVERLYFVKQLSDEEDVLRASRRALARTSKALAEAHNRMGAEHVPATDEEVLDQAQIEAVTVLLESDLDPDAPYRWGWIDS